MITLAAVVVAAACSLPPDTRIVLESDDAVCDTFRICPAGTPVRFRLTTSATCDSYSWTFGDGATSAEREPVHTYANAAYNPVVLIAGTSQITTSVDTRPNPYELYALAATPVESTVRVGQTFAINVRKRFANAGEFYINCDGAITCPTTKIMPSGTSVYVNATATSLGAGGLSYFVAQFGGRPAGGGPFAVVRVMQNPPEPPPLPPCTLASYRMNPGAVMVEQGLVEPAQITVESEVACAFTPVELAPGEALAEVSPAAIGESQTIAIRGIRAGTTEVRLSEGVHDISVGTVTVFCTRPAIAASPARIDLHQGETALLTLTPSGSQPLSVQWFVDGKPLDGATSAQLLIKPSPGTFRYRARVTNDCGFVDSGEWEVVVAQARRRSVRK
jgi:PKD repeat protein